MNKIYNLIKAAHTFFKSAAAHRVGPYAAQASFFVLLSLVPFFMFLLSMINIIIPYFLPVSQVEILTRVYTFFPEPVSGTVEGIILDILDKSSGISIVTAATALWFSSRGMLALNQGINNVLSDGELQGYFRTRIMSVVYMLVFTLLITLTIVFLGFGNQIMKYLPGVLPSAMDALYNVLHLRWVIIFAILTLFFTLFYRFMPQKRRPFRQLIPGAALAAAGWLIFTFAFSVYVSFSKSYASIYGGISYIILAMLWLYFCMNILLYGAEFNHLLGKLKKNPTDIVENLQ